MGQNPVKATIIILTKTQKVKKVSGKHINYFFKNLAMKVCEKNSFLRKSAKNVSLY